MRFVYVCGGLFTYAGTNWLSSTVSQRVVRGQLLSFPYFFFIDTNVNHTLPGLVYLRQNVELVT